MPERPSIKSIQRMAAPQVARPLKEQRTALEREGEEYPLSRDDRAEASGKQEEQQDFEQHVGNSCVGEERLHGTRANRARGEGGRKQKGRKSCASCPSFLASK